MVSGCWLSAGPVQMHQVCTYIAVRLVKVEFCKAYVKLVMQHVDSCCLCKAFRHLYRGNLRPAVLQKSIIG